MERNFETVMIEQCAPVLASLKPAGLFRYETSDCADLARRVRSWNEQLGEKGLCVRVLKGCVRTHRYLVYVYRESKLRAVLAQPQVRDFLCKEGYTLPQQSDDYAPLLQQLSRRLPIWKLLLYSRWIRRKRQIPIFFIRLLRVFLMMPR